MRNHCPSGYALQSGARWWQFWRIQRCAACHNSGYVGHYRLGDSLRPADGGSEQLPSNAASNPWDQAGAGVERSPTPAQSAANDPVSIALKLHPQPGDVIVVQTKFRPQAWQVDGIREAVKRQLPAGVDVLVIGPDLSVVTSQPCEPSGLPNLRAEPKLVF